MTAPNPNLETWRDHMPAIPLARAVPIYAGFSHSSTGGLGENEGMESLVAGGWRVDLDDPQGFGYALRWYCRASFAVDPMQGLSPAADRLTDHRLTERWLVRGNTTDADRLALAKACAEVMA